jgi:replication factor A1
MKWVTEFILFGRIAQRLTKKSVDTLIAENPRDFIPNEVTRLLERVFVWNVRFTENTIQPGIFCFQVNVVVGEIDNGKALLPMSPAGSQSSSLMLSQGTSSNMQGTPQNGVALALPLPLAASEASHASSTTPTKLLMQNR